MKSRSLGTLLAVAWLWAIAAVPARADEPARPNVVFILADDLGWSDATLHGTTTLYETPNIDRLARRGMTFTRAYSASPLCSPTRAAVLTGMSPARLGLTSPSGHLPAVVLKARPGKTAAPGRKSVQPETVTRLDTSHRTLATALKEAGYATGHFGKWHLGPEPYSPLQHGFDVDIPHWHGPGPAGHYVAPWAFPAFKPRTPGEHLEDRMADEAVAWMEAHKDEPFFLNYWMFSVHAPFDAKEANVARHRGRIDPQDAQRSPTYAAMVQSMDDAVGTLLDALDRLGLADKTIVIFTSDNGGNMYDEVDGTTATSNRPLRGGKATMYEGGTRVPCVIAWPGKTTPGSRSEALVQSEDFYPTLLAGLGLEPAAGQRFDGASLLPALAGDPLAGRAIFQYFPHDPVVPDWLPPSVSVHCGDWKLIRIFHGGEAGTHDYRLYNLADDPGEQNNLAAAEPQRVADLDARIGAFLSETRAVLPVPNPAFDPAKYRPGRIGKVPPKPGAEEPRFLWTELVKQDDADRHVAFRGTFELDREADVEFRLLGAAWFVAWLDGEYFAEGPARFSAKHPEYQSHTARLPAGRHVLAVQVHHEGVDTRMLRNIPPFLHAEAMVAGRPLAVAWKCSPIGGHQIRMRRVNPQLGWIEWCDTRLVPEWQPLAYDDSRWPAPDAVTRPLGPLAPLSSGNARTLWHPATHVASGTLAERFGYEADDPQARFFLRDLEPADVPAQGLWRRYDLGRVRLMRPRFVLDLPAGAVVEFAYAEALTRGRVAPWITLSAGASCHVDHYVARGGPQEFFPLTPRGGRFLEVHVLAAPADVQRITFVKEEVAERCYYAAPDGSFACGDDLLDRIWSVGVETHRACAEDSLTDNPTRERGQWAGDVVTTGLDIAAAAFNDLRMCRRGLVQCAQCARADGLVSGMCPGPDIYLSTYAAQWLSACVRYWELTGDRELLEQLFDAAERNVAAFEKHRSADGVADAVGWGFVDWGYVRNPGPVDIAVNLHYLAALRDMRRWCEAIGKTDRAAHYRGLGDTLAAVIDRYYAGEFAAEPAGEAWTRIGYHRAALGLRLGFFSGDRERECVAHLKRHMRDCFPNDPSAPRLSDPAANNPRLITPYFAHFVMGELFARGEADFVLDQFRTCWGWSLGDGRTTWLEVFDTRWSHCHQWAGCPTWQLSRWCLGLHPRQDLGERHFVVRLEPGSLASASGRVPIPGGTGAVAVRWSREKGGIRYTVETPEPIMLHLPGGHEPVAVESRFERNLEERSAQ
ncbi:MAG: sulfatase-like hydrolase/transferase [Pirellulales bacterium]|jgi:arylsulfatase A-like enzyme